MHVVFDKENTLFILYDGDVEIKKLSVVDAEKLSISIGVALIRQKNPCGD